MHPHKREILSCAASAVFFCLSTPLASAITIAFDDAYPTLGEGGDPASFYLTDLGVTFSGNYYGLAGGTGNGDPGNWNMHGTNGSAFFAVNNVATGSPTINFDQEVIDFSVDVGIGQFGSQSTIELTATGFLDGAEVDEQSVFILTDGHVDGNWSTLTFSTTVDSVRIRKTGGGQIAYGIDNYQYLPGRYVWSAPMTGDFSEAGNWSQGVAPGNQVLGIDIQPTFGGKITRLQSSVTTNEFTLGAATGVATLEIGSSGTLIVNGTANVLPSGRVAGSGTFIVQSTEFTLDGVIDLSSGLTVVATEDFVNNGRLEGGGEIAVGTMLTNEGVISAAAGKQLRFVGGTVTNQNRIEAIGTPENRAAIIFEGGVSNETTSALIAVRDAVLRFDDGLSNDAGLAFSFGVSDVIGDVVNEASGSVVVAGNSGVTFYDDFDNSNGGTLNVATGSTAVFFGEMAGAGSVGGGDVQALGDLAPGSSPGVMSFSGGLSLGGTTTLQIELAGTEPGEFDVVNVAGAATLAGTLDVSLIDDFSPELGDAFEIFSAAGGLNSAFSTVNLPALDNALSWNLDYDYDAGSLLLAVDSQVNPDFDGDGDVDGDDLLQWGDDFGVNGDSDADGDGDSDGNDFLALQRRFGSSTGAANPSTTAVPEPGTFALAAFGLAALLWKARKVAPIRSTGARNVE